MVVWSSIAEGWPYQLERLTSFRLSFLRSDERGFKRQICQWWGRRNCGDEVSERPVSFEGGTLLLRETVTMLRNRDVIQWVPASCCMTLGTVSIIYLSIYLSIYLCLFETICFSFLLFSCIFCKNIPIYLSKWTLLAACPSVCLSDCMSVSDFVSLCVSNEVYV